MKIRMGLLICLGCFFILSCTEKEGPVSAGDIRIQSLTVSANPIKAWDTAWITMEATGSGLNYHWEANHGDITGSGNRVKYAAGQCCIGLNTITCRVFNETGEVADTVMVRVTSYYGP